MNFILSWSIVEQKTKVVGGGAASEIKKSDVVEKDWKEPLDLGSDYQRSGYGPEIWTTLIDMTQISRKTLDFIHKTAVKKYFCCSILDKIGRLKILLKLYIVKSIL